jgi:hypothetical protein
LADSVFTFVSAGGGDWREVARTFVPQVVFQANRGATALNLPYGVPTTVVFDDIAVNTESVAVVGGVYTIPSDGNYTITLTPHFSHDLFAGGYCSNNGPGVTIKITGQSDTWHSSPTSCPAGFVTYDMMTFSGWLTTGTTVYVEANNWDQFATVTVLPTDANGYNRLTIIRD